MKKFTSPFLFLLPLIIVIFALDNLPVFFNIFISFTKTNPQLTEFKFVGLNNYLKFLKDPLFVPIIRNSFIWTFEAVGLGFLISTLYALIIDSLKNKWIKKILEISILIPWVVPGIVNGMLWKWMLHPTLGIIPYFTRLLGISVPETGWLFDANSALHFCVIANLWRGLGFGTLVTYAALQSIPIHLYEAAMIDGASYWKRLSSITFPLIAPILVLRIILGLIWTFNFFDLIYALTGGGPGYATEILPISIYRIGWEYFYKEEAAAIAVISTMISMSFIIVYYLLNRRFGSVW